VGVRDWRLLYIGQSERNLHDVFAQARRSAPCVLFLDEVDALGLKRSQTRHSGLRGVVNQLLTELDNMSSDNERLFVLAFQKGRSFLRAVYPSGRDHFQMMVECLRQNPSSDFMKSHRKRAVKRSILEARKNERNKEIVYD
jgi:SpoVK/Ycf46/Vps4 family AAA+-type ATPase